ncbi:hypothetical protein SKAU_G00229650 [Synaphobranchus kaupii]|uniref:Uncharacterized protein n=1 Tax=Synaphobranchus kaupii TaxID=118154 RepID=A0A9Q1IT51_SYNKA|nr:hypothetical protein SKAU_G00229650 [Synaphobranchus kaupii]
MWMSIAVHVPKVVWIQSRQGTHRQSHAPGLVCMVSHALCSPCHTPGTGSRLFAQDSFPQLCGKQSGKAVKVGRWVYGREVGAGSLCADEVGQSEARSTALRWTRKQGAAWERRSPRQAKYFPLSPPSLRKQSVSLFMDLEPLSFRTFSSNRLH